MAMEEPAPAPVAVALRPDQIEVMAGALAGAEAHGLPAMEVDATLARQLLASSDPALKEKGLTRLVAAVIRYVRAQRGGRLSSVAFPREWSIRPARDDPEQAFAAAVAEDRLAAWLESAPPPFEGYRRLVEALARYRAVRDAGGWARIGPGSLLKEGVRDSRVERLRRRLAGEDAAVESTQTPSDAFDPALTAALKRFQARNGLDESGLADAAALAALDEPVERRIDRILANLERWRWLPRVLPADRIEINIAAADLHRFEGHRSVEAMRIIVGKPSTRTPMFASAIQSVLFNPPWNVPASIARNELLPQERKSPGSLARRGFAMTRGPGGTVHLQQRPGPNNALGRIKFEIPNPFTVYLHDTPSRSLFQRDVRTLSHGCMRLERPRELAEALLRETPEGRPERIEAALATFATRRVFLPRPEPVFVLYWTAFADEAGLLSLRKDVYGWDDRLLALIGRS